MDVAEVKEYLLQVRKQEHVIRRKKERVEKLLEAAEGTSVMNFSQVKVQTSHNYHRNEELIAVAIDLQAEIVNDTIMLMDMVHERCKYIIDMNDNPLHIEILFKYYITGKSLSEIQQTITKANGDHYSERNIIYAHGHALEAIAEVISNQ